MPWPLLLRGPDEQQGDAQQAQHGLEQPVRLPLGDLGLLELHYQVRCQTSQSSLSSFLLYMENISVERTASELSAALAWTLHLKSGLSEITKVQSTLPPL